MIDLHALEHAEYMATLESIARSTVGIAFQDNQGVGTGTLVSYNDQPFLLTAEHVLRGNKAADMRFFIPPPTPLKEHDMRDGIPEEFGPPGIGEPLRLADHVIVDRANDLAAVPLTSTTMIPDYMKFFRVDRILENIMDDVSVLTLGFPVDNSAPFSRQGSQVFRALGLTSHLANYSQAHQSAYTLHHSFDRDRHFVVEYDKTGEGINPPGFSGAGVWCVRDPSGVVWQPRPVLAGVVTKWHKQTARQPHLIQATRGSVIRELFEKKR